MWTMSELSDLINDALARKGWAGYSLRELASRSNGDLSKDAIHKYRRGQHGKPDEETLQALADLTGESLANLRQAAHIPAGGLGPYEPPVEAVRLSRRQRLAIDELIRSMVGVEDPVERRRADVQFLLDNPELDETLSTRLAELRNTSVTSKRQLVTLEGRIRDTRRESLLAELKSLPTTGQSAE
jgi:transcriptional regulator with XRE-family HTH domain